MSVERRILPFGGAAVLVELPDLEAVLGLHAGLAVEPPAGVIELVPAARTILVRFDPARIGQAEVRRWILATPPAAVAPRGAAEAELPVVYDGEDLAETARMLGVTAAELVTRHAATRWRVAFTGFAPGFGYLVGDGWDLDVPRLDAPRTRVPAGSVALAAGFSAAYPRATPGGWRLIGRTDAPLFDPTAAEPALLRPGMRVRFRPERALAVAAPLPPVPPEAAAPAFRVEEAGALATVQDAGRPGRAADGIAPAGFADAPAARLANRLVGNGEGVAAVEIVLGPWRARALADLWIAVTGGLGPVRIDGREHGNSRALPWPAETLLEIGPLHTGLRAYLAVRGGVDASVAVGSRATDTLAGLGATAIAAGSVLALGGETVGPIPAVDPAPWAAPTAGVLELELLPGPRAEAFTPDARALLYGAPWRVAAAADRVGIRLDGPRLERLPPIDELPSEGMVPGALQVPPAGRPVVLGVDGPVTGGYPVIAVLTPAGLAALAQARPGAALRFRRAPGLRT